MASSSSPTTPVSATPFLLRLFYAIGAQNSYRRGLSEIKRELQLLVLPTTTLGDIAYFVRDAVKEARDMHTSLHFSVVVPHKDRYASWKTTPLGRVARRALKFSKDKAEEVEEEEGEEDVICEDAKKTVGGLMLEPGDYLDIFIATSSSSSSHSSRKDKNIYGGGGGGGGGGGDRGAGERRRGDDDLRESKKKKQSHTKTHAQGKGHGGRAGDSCSW